MQLVRTFSSLLGMLVVFAVTVITAGPVQAQAQCPSSLSVCEGWNGVYNSATSNLASYAFVDAVPYMSNVNCSNGTCDICAAFELIFNNYNSTNTKGIIVDARGVATPAYCSASPWQAFGVSAPASTAILLPAGTIYLQQGWVLPNATRIVGEGPALTTLQVCPPGTGSCTGGFTSGDMIDMGAHSSQVCNQVASLWDCQGVVVEHLGLNGNAQNVNGIVNLGAEELSRVDDVWMSNTGSGNGLSITQSGTNSGPYTKIYYSGAGTCARIGPGSGETRGPTDTRGIHGLTCVMTGGSSSAAIYVDTTGSTLEDVYISGSSPAQDGVLLGANAAAPDNTLLNVGGTGLSSVVHISSANATSDIALLGVTYLSPEPSSYTIKDDFSFSGAGGGLSSTTDPYVGMYILGDAVQGNGGVVGYSRFTTSQSVPAWIVGTNAPTSSSCPVGSLYSESSASNDSTTLWACNVPSSGWTNID
jgi:hypothetical protein